MEQEFTQSKIHINLKKKTNKLSKSIPSVHLIVVNISFCSVPDEISFTLPFRLTKKRFFLRSGKFCFIHKVGFKAQKAINKMYLRVYILHTHDLKNDLIILHSF